MPDDELDKLQRKIYMWVFVAVLGGNLGTLFNAASPEARKDAYTGTQGSIVERKVERHEKKIERHETRLDSIEVVVGSMEDKIHNYVDREFRKEERECAEYRKGIAKQIQEIDFKQRQVISTLQHRGVNLDIRGSNK